MNEKISQYVEKLSNSGDLLKIIQNKDEAIKFIAKETKLPEAECAKVYDSVLEKVKGGIAGKLGDKVKLPFNLG